MVDDAWKNLNLRYNVTERIIGPPLPAYDETDDLTVGNGADGCLEAFVGERWVRAVPPWITATPAARDEFYNRFAGARYVIDQGVTGQEQTITIEAKKKDKILFQGVVPNPGEPPVSPPWTQGLPVIVPVSPVFDKLPPAITRVSST